MSYEVCCRQIYLYLRFDKRFQNVLRYIHNHKTFVPKIRAIQVNFDDNCSYDMKHVISCGNHERSMSFSRASSRNHHVLMLFPVNRRVDFSRTRSDFIIGLEYIIGVYDDNNPTWL